MHKTDIFSLVLLLFLPVAVKAADLNECMERAVANSPYLKSARESILAANAAHNSDISAMFPQIMASGEMDYTQGTQEKAGIQADINLPGILSFYPGISGINLDKAKLAFEAAKLDTEKNVSVEYYQLYALYGREKAYGYIIDYLTRHIDDIRRMKQSGVDMDFDLMRTKGQLNMIRITQDEAENSIIKELIAINSVTGSSYKKEDFTFADVPEVDTATARFDGLEKTIVDNAEKSYTLRLSGYDLKMSAEADRQSIFNFVPVLQAGITYNNYNSPSLKNDSLAFASASFPIVDFGKIWSRNAALNREYNAQKEYYGGARRDYIVYIKQLFADMRHLSSIIEEASGNVDDGKKLIAAGDEEYKRGRIKETDLSDAIVQYNDAVDKYYTVLSDYLSKSTELGYIIKEETAD
jgi:outer membrane protein TolC